MRFLEVFFSIILEKKKGTCFIVAATLVCVLAIALYVHRAELSLYVWKEWRIAPEYVAAQNPENGILLFEMGQYYFNEYKNGVYDIDKAEQYYIRSLEVEPQIGAAWYQLARISFLKGQFATALYRINKQLELHEPFAAVYYTRGLIYGFDKQYQKAEEDFKHFLAEYKPESPWGHTDLAWFHFMQGEFEESAAVAKRGLAYNPDHPWLLNAYGVALINLDREAEALEPLERAYEESLKLTEEDWGNAYPGNDPAIRAESLASMRQNIQKNIELVRGD